LWKCVFVRSKTPILFYTKILNLEIIFWEKNWCKKAKNWFKKAKKNNVKKQKKK